MEKFLKRPIVYLLLACASLFFLPLGMRALWDPVEGRYAEIAREMLELKQWLIPHLNYVVYLERPPLLYWLTAVSLRLIGPTPFAARFCCAVFGLATVYLTYRWAEYWKNERVGLLAGGILATSLGYFVFTQVLVLETVLTFWTTLVLMAGSRLLVERSVHSARRCTYLLALGLAGAILTYGFSAVFLLVVTLWAAYVAQGRRVPVVKRPWKAALLIAGLIALPWYVMVRLQYPSFLTHMMFHQHDAAGPASQPFYFYLPVLLAGLLPWSVFLPRMARTWLGQRHAALQRDPEGAVMVIWICLVFVFYSLFPSKSLSSLLPLFPAFALLLAHEFDTALEEAEAASATTMPAWVSRGVAALILLLFLALILVKVPYPALGVPGAELKVFSDQSGSLALAIGLGIFSLVGVWGMQQTLTCVGGVMLVQVLLLTSLASLAPQLDPFRSTRFLAERFSARAGTNDTLVLFHPGARHFPYSLNFYTGRRFAIYGSSGELGFGQEQASPEDAVWFVGEEKADELLPAIPSGSWVLTDLDHGQALRQNPLDSFQPMGQSGARLLLRKR